MFSCRTLLSDTFPPAGTVLSYGCPFKELKSLKLRDFISRELGVKSSDRDLEDIAKFSENNEYQRACVKTFEALYPSSDSSGVGNHPVEFYNTAVRNNYNKPK